MPLEPLLANLEQNISNDISVERLAEAGLLSRSQLYREYVRKRRLSTALALIKHTDMSLKKIAGECGFSGEQGLPVSVASETIPPTLRLQYYDSCPKGIENRALARLFASRPGYGGRIFGRKGAQKGPKLCYELYLDPSAVTRKMKTLLKRAGIDEIRFHDLRHTFATLSLQNGVDVKTLSHTLGHYSAGFTLDTYTHVTTQMQEDAALKIGGLMAAAQG